MSLLTERKQKDSLTSGEKQRHVRMPMQFKQSIRSEKWQTYLFVRNQMVLILLRAPSTSMTQPVIRSTPIIGPRSLCAGAELHRTSLSATAPTARSAFKRPKQSTRKAPNNIGGINAVQVFLHCNPDRATWRSHVCIDGSVNLRQVQ